jgi:hypothetical protein
VSGKWRDLIFDAPVRRRKSAQSAYPRFPSRLLGAAALHFGEIAMAIDLIGWLTILYGILMYRLALGPMVMMFVLATLFQAAAAVKFGDTGVPPGHLLLSVVLLYFIKKCDVVANIGLLIRFPKEGFWLLLLILYCVFTGLFAPRLFLYATDVNPIGATAFDPSFSTVPLGPSSGNITQSIYIVGASASFFVISYFLSSSGRLKTMMRAFLVYTVANIGFGFLDLVTYWTDTSYFLDFMHNGNYTFHLNEAELGFKRIAGTFSEASAFANATLGTVGFTLRLWLGGVYPLPTLFLTISGIVLLVLSTSTTAYVGLGVLIAVIYLSTLLSLLLRRKGVNGFYFAMMLPLVAVIALLGLALDQANWNTVADIWRAVVIDKSLSESAAERGALNAQALTNLFDTFGLGAGTGSVRTSSFPLALLANIGIPGTFIYGMFLSLIFLKGSAMPDGSIEKTIQAAARAGALGILIGATISGALIDLGLPFFILSAMACSLRSSPAFDKGSQPVPWRRSPMSKLAT